MSVEIQAKKMLYFKQKVINLLQNIISKKSE